MECILRHELEDPRTSRILERRLDLSDALEQLERARGLLTQSPDGAELALAVLAVELYRVRYKADVADRHYKGSRKGSTNAKLNRQRRIADAHATIRARAALLDPDLRPATKAEILARASKLSARQIRRIITK
jgi:hypothetical protein